ncbi:MAG: MFS transporter, partial [candidate division WOR-3 bacterium]
MVQEKKLTALIFKKRDFNFFLVSQILTQLGDKIDYIALIGLIGLYKDKASFYLALMAIFFTAPVFLFGPISGILIDRWNRKKILQISYLIRALLALLLPTIFLISRNIYPAFAIVFFIFLMNLFANTTRLAIIPNLVGQEAILVGNSAVSFVNRAATFVGMLTAGFIIDWPVWKVIFNIEGWQAGFYLDAFCFTVSAFLISFISLKFIPPETKFSILNVKSITQPFKTAYSKIKEALYLCLKNRRVTFALGSIFLLVISASTVYVLAIPTIQIDFNLGTKGVGLLGAIGAIG